MDPLLRKFLPFCCSNGQPKRRGSARWEASHPERASAIGKAWKAAHRAEVKAYQHAYYARNRERLLAKAKENYAKAKPELDSGLAALGQDQPV